MIELWEFCVKYNLHQYFFQGLGIGVFQIPILYIIYKKLRVENEKIHLRIDSVERRQDDKSKKIADLKDTVMQWLGKFDNFYTLFFEEYLPHLDRKIEDKKQEQELKTD